MKPKHVFLCVVVIWLLAVAPFFIPGLNVMEPHILGLPFIAFWDLLYVVLHIILLIVAANHAWDTFDKDGTDKPEGGDA